MATSLISRVLLVIFGATPASAAMHEMQERWNHHVGSDGQLLAKDTTQARSAKGHVKSPIGSHKLTLPPGIQTWQLPNWVLQSRLSELHGPLRCNTELGQGGVAPLTRRRMAVCHDENYKGFLEASSVLHDDPFNITRQFKDAVFLGTGGPCRAQRRKAASLQSLLRGFKPDDVRNVKPHRNVRLIVDEQYVNMPRCCRNRELNGLFLNQGAVDSWTTKAVSTLRLNTAKCGVNFVQVWPTKGRCEHRKECPLVVQIAGSGALVDNIGDPWLLIQSRCTSCMAELNTVLVSPQMPQDLIGENGDSMGSSNEVMRTTLIIFVEEMLDANEQLDRERVYLVAQSRGVDTGLRAVLEFPNMFHTAIFAGMFMMTNETMSMLADEDVLHNVRKSKLKEVQFHLGDQDRCFPQDIFYSSFPNALDSLGKTERLRVTVRIYTESKHSVWYAAWNSMHDVIWTGSRSLVQGIPQTCAGR